MLNNYTGRGRSWGQWVYPAANLAAGVVNAGLNAYARRPVIYNTQPVMPPPPPQGQLLPVRVYRGRGRGRGTSRRGRRARGRGRVGGVDRPIGTQGAGTITIQDTEILNIVGGKVEVFEFNPSATGLVRLERFETMYERYQVIYCEVKWVPTCPMTQTGFISYGISPSKLATVTDADAISKLKPSRATSPFQSGRISMNTTIDSHKFMHCGSDTAFVLYVRGDAGVGHFDIRYKIEFSFPRPF